MKLKHLILLLFLLPALPCRAQQNTGARQDGELLRAAVLQYLTEQTTGLPGQVSVDVGAVDPHLALAACPAPQVFQSPGARAWGKTTVGVRCTAPAAWTIYMQAKVGVLADYVATAMPIAPGLAIEAGQLVTLRGDIAALPAGIATMPGQVIGRSLTVAMPAGAPLRLDALRSKPVVLQGQLVRVSSNGAGFSVSTEAHAIGTAAEGQVVQVRTRNGAILSGVAKTGGLVEVVF